MKVLTILLALLVSSPALAVDASVLTKDWQHTEFGLYLDPQEAYDMKTADPEGVLFLDVSTRAEIHYLGMATSIDVNIPYRFESTEWKMKKDGVYGTFKKPKNPDYVPAVERVLEARGLTRESPIIIMCASGTRSPFAADLLHEAGFKQVYTQIEGFVGSKAKEGPDKGKRVVNGWKNADLPWSYDLLPEKMYFNYAAQPNSKPAS